MSEHKRGFLVLGPESSCTRLVTKILIVAGGCAGSYDHVQPFDDLPMGDADNVVLRRSIPHGGQTPDLSSVADMFGSRELLCVVAVRDWHCTAMSQVEVGLASSFAVAKQRISQATLTIWEFILSSGLPFVVVTAESLMLHPESAQRQLLESIGLRYDQLVPIADCNDKHYQ